MGLISCVLLTTPTTCCSPPQTQMITGSLIFLYGRTRYFFHSLVILTRSPHWRWTPLMTSSSLARKMALLGSLISTLEPAMLSIQEPSVSALITQALSLQLESSLLILLTRLELGNHKLSIFTMSKMKSSRKTHSKAFISTPKQSSLP